MYPNSLHASREPSRRAGSLRRRDFLRLGSVGMAAALGWRGELALRADELKKNGKACILLWMDGGPSQFETFDPKPGTKTGGPTPSIASAVPGVQFSENLPKVAAAADKLCVVRSMTAKEGSHPRATYYTQTGYLPTAALKHPALGAHVAMQLQNLESELPSFVSIGGGGRSAGSAGGGYLGVDHAPFFVASSEKPPENTTIATREDRFQRRMDLLSRLEGEFQENGGGETVAEHRKIYEAAARMILSPKMSAFDASEEPASVRSEYGDGEFAVGCLIARRLLEAGVSFVQVNLRGWDTHDDNFDRCKSLCGPMDRAYAALLADLDRRGMLDSTLVLWMGEFGRTPTINPRSGRDHFPKAYSAALAGCGVLGGQAIGSTDDRGTEVVDRPITVPDLLRTAMTALGIDPDLEHQTSIGRPIATVEGGVVIEGALG